MGLERFEIKSADGYILSCICFIPAAEPKFQLVVAHGFRGRKENSGRINVLAQRVGDLGGILWAFDFAGSGESEGAFADMTLSRQARDLTAVIERAVRQYTIPLFVLGRSFGGSTAIAACSGDPRVDGLILWSTPVLLEATFARIMPNTMKRLLGGDPVIVQDGPDIYTLGSAFAMDFAEHNFVQYLRWIHQPVLVVQGIADTTVLVENSAVIEQNAGGPVELHLIEGADHRFTNCISYREDLTLDWLKNKMKAKE
ncbi:MAG: alpha/beta hydrolase [Ignavibacteriales bacterium]